MYYVKTQYSYDHTFYTFRNNYSHTFQYSYDVYICTLMIIYVHGLYKPRFNK